MRTHTRRAAVSFALACACATLAGTCGGGGATPDAAPRDGSDGPRTDQPAPDLPGADASPDKGGDGAADVTADPSTDTAPDATGDGPAETATDAESEVAADSPDDDAEAGDAPIDATDTASDKPAEAPPPAGCADGTREGFKNDGTFPDVAACGGGSGTTPIGYGSAKAFASSICAAGWHWCSLADLAGLPSTPPTYDAAFAPCAWVDEETTSCTRTFTAYGLGSCGGTVIVTSSTHGAGSCSMPSSGCSDGWRPMIPFDTWTFRSLRDDFLLTCRPHLTLGCGTDFAKQCWVACCKD